jgi:outer membrane beta-barrel protein
MKRITPIWVFIILAVIFGGNIKGVSAQEVLLEGPLAGAPAVRKLVQYRKMRFGIAPYFNYTLNNEFVHNFLVGAHLEFNITDWFGIGINAAYAFNADTKLTKHISESRDIGDDPTTPAASNWPSYTGADNFENQVSQMKGQYLAQLNFVPFRGKVAFFQRLFTAVDLSIFVGAGIVHFKERNFCDSNPPNSTCGDPANPNLSLVNRIAPAPTAGLSFNFYANDWATVNIELRFTPFKWNAGGTDESGAAAGSWVCYESDGSICDQTIAVQDIPSGRYWQYNTSSESGDYPDGKIDKEDRQWTTNASIGIGAVFYFPTKPKISE